MDELSAILSEILPLIEKKMNAATSTFKLWFGEFNMVSLTDTSATFTTSSPLKKQILSTKYMDIIKESLNYVIGFTVDVVILTHDEAKRGLTADTAQPAVVERREEKLPFIQKDDKPLDEEYQKEKEISDIINGPQDRHSVLDDYTFDNFVEGSSNKFARAACFAVANEPCTYNPLFIYGNSGLGKTHLLYAIINHMRKNHPTLRIIYKKCETFLDELIRAINKGQTIQFKEKYRSCDVLLIDDIQFLADRKGTQEEFFHTFSALYESDKQIILTSDRPPREIKHLADRLRTRFEGGLLADVQPPDYELRMAIIRKKADDMELNISNEMVEYMANRLHNNIRQIEGVLKRLFAIYSFSSAEVTKEKIDESISIIDPDNIPNDTLIEKILSTVSNAYSIPIEQIKSGKRTDNIANARHIAIYIIKQMTNLTLREVGDIFGRDHSTIISSINKVEENIRTVNNYEENINKLMESVKGR